MNQKFRFALMLVMAALFNLFGRASAQEIPGKKDSINSTVLNEKRIIQVILPESFTPGSADKYDVLYVLDDGNIKLASDVQRFLQSEGKMPPTIIVGIINIDRDKDFLPTHNKETQTSGGADKFLKFFKDELIPYVNKNYPSNGDNTLFGHSFGGVFVTYALLNEPQLFKSFIAGDPSFWWDDNVMLKQVKEKLPSLANLDRTFFICGREGQGMKDMRIPQMDSLLKKDVPKGLSWMVTSYPDETHGSIRLKSLYDGLKFSYAGYNRKALEFHPSNGVIMKDKPIAIWYFDDTTKVHYTIDGSVPTIASPQIQPEITLSGPAELTLKHVSTRVTDTKTVTGKFTAGGYLPTEKLKKDYKPGGFNYAYYEGMWDKLPDFKTLKPVKEGLIDTNFNIDKFPHQDNFGLVIDGQFKVVEEGYYIFGVASDDGSKIYLNGEQIVNNDGLHNADGQQTYIVPLQKGFYSLRVEYFQKDGGRTLIYRYLTPSDIPKKHPSSIPQELQYGRR